MNTKNRIIAAGIVLALAGGAKAYITRIASMDTAVLPGTYFYVNNSALEQVYGYGTGFITGLQDQAGHPVLNRSVSLTVLSHDSGGGQWYKWSWGEHGEEWITVPGQDVFGEKGWSKTGGRTAYPNGEVLSGVGYGSKLIFPKHCDYQSGGQLCDERLPPGTPPIAMPAVPGYYCSLVKVKLENKVLGHALQQKASVFIEWANADMWQGPFWAASAEREGTGHAELNSSSSTSIQTSSSIGISGVTMTVTAASPKDMERLMTMTVTSPPKVAAPPQDVDIQSVNGWCQWTVGHYEQKLCIVPEPFDGDEENKPASICDITGPYVYVTTMPTTADNQSMLLYSYSECNDVVGVTRVIMHKQGNKFVSDYIIATDMGEYAGTLTGESGQTYRCVFVEENGRLDIKPDDLYGDFDKNGVVDLNDFGYFGQFWQLTAADEGYQVFLDTDLDGVISFDDLAEWCSSYLTVQPKHIVDLTDFSREAKLETVDSLLPFFQRYLKDKFAP